MRPSSSSAPKSTPRGREGRREGRRKGGGGEDRALCAVDTVITQKNGEDGEGGEEGGQDIPR